MITLNVPDMTCGHCKASVEQALAGVDPMAIVAVDLTTRHVDVTTTATPAALIGALKTVGFAATAA